MDTVVSFQIIFKSAVESSSGKTLGSKEGVKLKIRTI